MPNKCINASQRLETPICPVDESDCVGLSCTKTPYPEACSRYWANNATASGLNTTHEAETAIK